MSLCLVSVVDISSGITMVEAFTFSRAKLCPAEPRFVYAVFMIMATKSKICIMCFSYIASCSKGKIYFNGKVYLNMVGLPSNPF